VGAGAPLSGRQGLSRLLKRPQVHLTELVGPAGPLEAPPFDTDTLVVAEMEVKYEGYIRRERERALALAAREKLPLPVNAPYLDFTSLSFEARQKLSAVRPVTLGQAGRIPGVSPSDLQNLLVELRKHGPFEASRPVPEATRESST
jgi:tRNA uridine 5-carboxymethylaminomethyl modification enzyme